MASPQPHKYDCYQHPEEIERYLHSDLILHG
jgi:hypothetical protein